MLSDDKNSNKGTSEVLNIDNYFPFPSSRQNEFECLIFLVYILSYEWKQIRKKITFDDFRGIVCL